MPTMLATQGATMRTGDEQLVARCRAGEVDAFAQVYALYERSVFRYAYHLLGHREDADDVKQETFVRAFQAIGRFRRDATLLTWLLKICGNLCRDRMKSWERRHVCYDANEHCEWTVSSDHTADPVAVVERSATTATILRALHSLPPIQREVLILHEIEELSYEEIAQVLGCSPVSAKLRAFRARLRLKEKVTALLELR